MTSATLLAYGGNILRELDLSTVDARFALRGTQPTPKDVVVVGIDDETFDDLGVQWPFPRSLHGRVIDRLRRAGADVIGYDVQFTEQTTPREDNALIEAVARARNVVLATTEVDAQGHTAIFGGDAVLRQIHATAGNAVFEVDTGGVIRRMPRKVSKLRGFAIAIAEEALGHPAKRSGRSTEWIDYRGPPGTIATVPFSRVLDGRAKPSMFRDKIVIVGPEASNLHDVHPTSTSGGSLMSGAEIEANAVWSALHGFPLRGMSEAWTVLLVVLFGFLAPLAGLRLSLLRTLMVALVVGAAFLACVYVAFLHGLIVPFVYPATALALSTVGALGAHYSVAAFERQRVRDIFSRFVPEQVVDQVLARADADLRLGGVSVEGTVMFTDVRGFTTFSEALSPEQVIDVINRYLTEMSEAILAHGGTLISFAGDGILALFGAPIEQADHADRAIATAREMLLDRLPRFNEWLTQAGHGPGFRMGIGLNSGSFVAGNVGSERRLEYTVIGDIVNTASRIEGLTKGTPHQLLFSDSTRASLRVQPDDLTFVLESPIRGRSATTKLWSLVSVSDAVPDAGSVRAVGESAQESVASG
jgi:adenylate cyclase